MLGKKKKIYSRRGKSYLLPTLVILFISAAAALGGALYWDKMQQEAENSIVASTKEEDVLVSPEEQTPEPKQEQEPEPEPGPEPIPTVVPESEEADSTYFADAAFVGDSLTQGIQLYEVMETNVVANKGVNLYTALDEDKIRVAEGYASIIEVLEELNPKKIYILLGANDVGWRSESDFKKLYTELLDEIQKQHPESLVYLQSMFPVTKTYSETDNGITNEKLVEYNKIILEIAEERGIYYLDVASCLKDETGALPEAVSPDGMHLNPDYYKKWFSYLSTHTVKVTEE